MHTSAGDPVNGPTLSLSLLSNRHCESLLPCIPELDRDSLGCIEKLGDWSFALFLSRSFFLAISLVLACMKGGFVCELPYCKC